MPTNGPQRTNVEGQSSRREFLQQSGTLVAGSLLAMAAVPHVHAAEQNTIRLALIGCGGRGSGAVDNAFSVANGPVQLTAMADVIETRMTSAHKTLSEMYPQQVDVPPERRFVGFDAYKKAIDSLGPGDVAMLTGYAGFRPVQLEYAVSRGVNVFMEKSFATDPPGARRVIAAGAEAEKKNLKIAAGLMCRHSTARQAMIQKIRDGEMGQVQLIRAYRMDPGYQMGPFQRGQNELLWQLSPGHPFQFLWSSGGIFIELMIHQIDECFWIKDSWPVSAHGVGGRFAGSTDCSQNLDSYAIEYTFADGTKAQVTGRYIPGCYNDFATFVHGTKCAGQFSGAVHAPTCRIFKDQNIDAAGTVWKAEKEAVNPWQNEWDVLLSAIRQDRKHNEAKRAALANLGAIIGRAAVHTGRLITWEEAMASNFQFFADVDKLTADSPAPVQADAQGRYPAPVPGKWVEV